MPEARIVALRGLRCELEPGEYVWCGCGRTAGEPWCDASGECSRIAARPLRFVNERKRSIKLCQCRRSGNPPYCDGTHYRVDDPEAPGSEETT